MLNGWVAWRTRRGGGIVLGGSGCQSCGGVGWCVCVSASSAARADCVCQVRHEEQLHADLESVHGFLVVGVACARNDHAEIPRFAVVSSTAS
eukprot:2649711-Amphidinium_carterae.1